MSACGIDGPRLPETATVAIPVAQRSSWKVFTV